MVALALIRLLLGFGLTQAGSGFTAPHKAMIFLKGNQS
jgi:hypothetical protein